MIVKLTNPQTGRFKMYDTGVVHWNHPRSVGIYQQIINTDLSQTQYVMDEVTKYFMGLSIPQKKYTKEQILKAGELGEVSMIDIRHIVSLLDEVV